MAASYVKNWTHDNAGSSATTCAATAASASALGNGIVVLINWDATGGATVTGVSDGHNTYVRNVASSITSGTAGGFEEWVCKSNNFNGGALTVTATTSASLSFTAIDCVEVTGHDQTSGGIGSGLAVASAAANSDINGSALTAPSGGLLFVGAQWASSSSGCTNAAGYTLLNAGGGFNMTDAYKAVGAGSVTPQIHNGGTVQNAVISALFIPDAGSPAVSDGDAEGAGLEARAASAAMGWASALAWAVVPAMAMGLGGGADLPQAAAAAVDDAPAASAPRPWPDAPWAVPPPAWLLAGPEVTLTAPTISGYEDQGWRRLPQPWGLDWSPPTLPLLPSVVDFPGTAPAIVDCQPTATMPIVWPDGPFAWRPVYVRGDEWAPAPSTAPALGAHGLFARDESFGSDPALSNSNGGAGITCVLNTTTGSMLLAWSMGWQANSGTPNADSKGNVYDLVLGPNTYAAGGPFSTQLFRSRGYIVGGSGHFFSYAEPAGGGHSNGEISAPVVEILNGGKIQATAYAYSQPAGGAPYTETAGTVTTTGPALLIALWGGDSFGLTHDATPDNGFTVIDSYLNLGPSSAVQVAVAVKAVAGAGTYGCNWTSNSDSGAAVYLIAVQAADPIVEDQQVPPPRVVWTEVWGQPPPPPPDDFGPPFVPVYDEGQTAAPRVRWPDEVFAPPPRYFGGDPAEFVPTDDQPQPPPRIAWPLEVFAPPPPWSRGDEMEFVPPADEQPGDLPLIVWAPDFWAPPAAMFGGDDLPPTAAAQVDESPAPFVQPAPWPLAPWVPWPLPGWGDEIPTAAAAVVEESPRPAPAIVWPADPWTVPVPWPAPDDLIFSAQDEPASWRAAPIAWPDPPWAPPWPPALDELPAAVAPALEESAIPPPAVVWPLEAWPAARPWAPAEQVPAAAAPAIDEGPGVLRLVVWPLDVFAVPSPALASREAAAVGTMSAPPRVFIGIADALAATLTIEDAPLATLTITDEV